jgi:hypothetical protein
VTGFTFSAEQIKAAPLEVRRWMEGQILAALRLPDERDERRSAIDPGALAECDLNEAVQIFQRISHWFPVTQVFFELGRESGFSQETAQLHILNLDEMRRHAQLGDARQLAECLAAIDRALQQVRNDPRASLFATDGQGHIFVHRATFNAICALRERLLHAQEANAERTTEAVDAENGAPGLEPEYAFRGGRQHSSE